MCKRDSVCAIAVRKGDDSGHAGTRNRMSECHDMVCERRDTQVCVGGMSTTTATEERRPSSAGFAQRRARGSCRAAHEATTCALAGVKPGPGTPAVNVADPATDKSQAG